MGGVRICTLEFIDLLKQKYEVIVFPVKINTSIIFRIKSRVGLGLYDAYQPDKYLVQLTNIIKQNNIDLVFLNLSNTLRFSSTVKEGSRGNAKIVMCSHGNESGDFLHEAVRFRKKMPFIRNLFSAFALGRMLKIESFYRLYYIDMVLTVSEVETEIEKWLGSKKVFLVPRTVNQRFLPMNPVENRVGFMGDLSHLPNISAIISFCDALNKLDHKINFRIAGGPSRTGKALQKQYPFVSYLGYLEEPALEKECITWCMFLNLVFYYSRGVSTKLAKSLGWGLPVISTTAGTRGYTWKRGKILIAETPAEMAQLVINNMSNRQQLLNNAKEIATSMPTLKDIMDELSPQLQRL